MNRVETLTQTVIERLAKEAGGEEYGPRTWNISFKRDALHRFADLIANFCEEFSTPIVAGGGEALREAYDFLGKVQGVALGVALSGSSHPDPDGALMGLFRDAQEHAEKLRAALSTAGAAEAVMWRRRGKFQWHYRESAPPKGDAGWLPLFDAPLASPPSDTEEKRS